MIRNNQPFLFHSAGHSYYGLRIATVDQEDGSSSSDMHADSCITLIGSKAKSKVINIQMVKHEDLILECSDNLGEVQGIVLENKLSEIQARVYDFQEQVLPSTAAENAELSSTAAGE